MVSRTGWSTSPNFPSRYFSTLVGSMGASLFRAQRKEGMCTVPDLFPDFR